MGTRAKEKIIVSRDKLEAASAALGINSQIDLVLKLKPIIDEVSVASINRWNAQGWPVWKYRALRKILGVDVKLENA